jgi:transposase InsO family protein
MFLQTAEALFTHFFRHYWVSEDIVSDRCPQFTSRVWRVFTERLGVSISLTSGFHPESNGQVERVNQDVAKFLWSYCQDRPGEWVVFVLWAEIAPLLNQPLPLSVCIGVPAGSATEASESDQGSCGG